MRHLHPFDITVLVLAAAGLLPISVGWRALVWIATIAGGALVLRRIGHERKNQLSRATMMPTEARRNDPVR